MGTMFNLIKTYLPFLSTGDVSLILLAFFILELAIAVFIYNDSKNRGGRSVNWVIASILLGGIIVLHRWR